MKVAFYKAKYGNWLSKFIAAYTRGPFSHAELVFDEKFRNQIAPKLVAHDPGGSMCFSSELKTGVRFKEINLADGKWETVEVPITQDGEQTVLSQALQLVGQPYDVMGILAFVVPGMKGLDGAEFCSESDIMALQADGLLLALNPGRTDPNALYRALTSSGSTPESANRG